LRSRARAAADAGRGAAARRRGRADARRHRAPRRRRQGREHGLGDAERRLVVRLAGDPCARLAARHPRADVLARGGASGFTPARRAAAHDALAGAGAPRRQAVARVGDTRRRPAGAVGVSRLPPSAPARPQPAGGNRRARVRHQPPHLVLLPARIRTEVDRGRGPLRRGDRRRPSPTGPRRDGHTRLVARPRDGGRARGRAAARRRQSARHAGLRCRAEMEPLYKPDGVEERWQRTWEEEGHYNADPDASRSSFAIAHPPPNVTGDLHLGHALQLSLADTIVRTRRMQGYNTLFQPGFDHAGISTQNAVEKHLATEGKTRQDLGREKFEQRVWEWLREYGGKIMSQFRRTGASLDYRRERFTMDAGYVRAVTRFFVHRYDKGWIYRANRIINWCPFHLTSLSDLELEHVDVDDTLTYVRYPLADGDGHITIATVRLATMLADVAVAVHPEDDRYKDLVGRKVIVPVVERRVPVIADDRVEREFGTGALKVTPGHDPMDYEIGRDHDLPELTVIGPDGRMNAEAGPAYEGLTQEEADARV